jgi:non-specific serine/threonine protein kinase
MRYLAALLGSPLREVLALDLVAPNRGHPDSTGAEDGVLDARARSEYRRRIRELQEELDDAERRNDIGLAAKRREDIESVLNELSRSSGLSGRQRRSASAAERARVNVTRAIKTAISVLARHDAILGRHLATSIRTGTFCVYSPDPSSTIRWSL